MADLLAICQDEAKAAPDRASRLAPASSRTRRRTRALRAEALIQRGVLYELRGEREDAVRDYTEAIKLEDTNALAYFNRGNATTSSASSTRPSPTTREAIKLDPTDPDFYNNRGQVYDSRGEHDLAIADYTEADPSGQEQRQAVLQSRAVLRQQGRLQARDRRLRRSDQASLPTMPISTLRAGRRTRSWAIGPPPARTTARRWRSTPTTRTRWKGSAASAGLG